MSDNDSLPIAPSTDDQRQGQQRDLVFNAETCRAIRQKARNLGLASVVAAPILCVALGFVIVLSVLPLPLIVSFIATVAVALLASTTVAMGLMWIGVVPEKALRRELRHVIDDPDALREGNEDEPAVPALAAGRSGFDWMYILGMPLMLILWMDISDDISPLLIAGCIVLGVGLFLLGPTSDASRAQREPDHPATTENSDR